jgi:hypothetical protein
VEATLDDLRFRASDLGHRLYLALARSEGW